MNNDLFQATTLAGLPLKNRIVMSPMTRNRSLGNIPHHLVATYYGQRAGAGLIVTEGTSPSPNGLGYPRIPGLFSEAQVAGWREVTTAVHDREGRIFVQFMHTGRIGHPANLPEGAELLGPMAEAAAGEIYTDTSGLQPHPAPRAMTNADLQSAILEFAQAAMTGFEAASKSSVPGTSGVKNLPSPLKNLRVGRSDPGLSASATGIPGPARNLLLHGCGRKAG